MELFSIVTAPNPIFRKKAALVAEVNDNMRAIIDRMFATMQHEQAVGLGANMVGLLQQIAVVDLHENGVSKPYCFINPKILQASDELQSFEEASLSFPGISAEISRPAKITIEYLNYDGSSQQLEADGFFAAVIQHEMDYLHGKTFLDHLSKMKRDMLVKKMLKHIKAHPPHVHGAHCNH